MKHSRLQAPQALKLICKSGGFTLLITAIATILSFALMYTMDKSTFTESIQNEIDSLIQIANIYDGADYTHNDLFYARMKQALLAYSDRNTACSTYAVIKNHDGIVSVSSIEALRAYILPPNASTGFDSYCEDQTVLQWIFTNHSEEANSQESLHSATTTEIIVEDAYLQNHCLFIPGNISKIKTYAELNPETNHYEYGDYELLHADFSELSAENPTAKQIDTESEGYRIMLDNAPHGISASDQVFQYVDANCELRSGQQKLGSIIIYHQAQLAHGSDSLVLYACLNVFEAHSLRYAVVFLSILILTAGSSFVTTTLIYFARKKTYEENLFQTTLINRLSHDLKTPITAMIGYCENLLYHLDTEKRVHDATAIHQNAIYMNDIIQNVLLFSKTEASDMRLHKSRLDLIALSRSVSEKNHMIFSEKNLTLQLSGCCEIEADQFLMEQLLENLFSNAGKYATYGTTIYVTGNNQSFSVTNHCDSLPSFDANELWKPFVKGDKSRGNRTGSGIGLSIVKNICTLHHFTPALSFASNQFTVTIFFPLRNGR